MDKKLEKYLIDIITAGLENDISMIETASLGLSRVIKKENPELSSLINNVLTKYSSSGGVLRGNFSQPLPVNEDSQLEMVTIVAPSLESNPRPILSESFTQKIESFLNERDKLSVLIEQGLKPSNSILLIGQPGTGKTMTAKYIAAALNKNLIVLDLSSSISSLLGKTGANLKKVLTYAKNSASVLLLDEFDAIAKRRDDVTDLGEIKRVVNVLLMELENWPMSSVLIATSNHPELLDRAIWRRFDHVWEIGVPDDNERTNLLNAELDLFLNASSKKNVLPIINEFLDGRSAADIVKYSNNIKRRMVLRDDDFQLASLMEIAPFLKDKKSRGRFCTIAKSKLGDAITLNDLSLITGLSISGVQHHIKSNQNE